jgi:hypothetical protein
VTGLVVMLAPVSLTRNDLKPYTCDAFVAVSLLAIAAWAEREGTRRSIVVLGVSALVALPFSTTTVFVVPAVLVGLLGAACVDRDLRRVRDLVVGGALIGGALLAYFALMIAPNLNDKLRAYWNGLYLNGSVGHTLLLAWRRFVETAQLLGAPKFLLLALFGAGVVVLTRVRARSVAIAVPLLWVEMIVVGRAQRYPFLDVRTSHFLFVSSLVLVALGAVGVVGLLSRLWVARHPLIGTGLAVVAAITLAAVFYSGFHSYVRVLNIRPEDVRAETLAVAARRHPHDVVLVDAASDFGLAYYWPHPPRLTFPTADTGQGFAARVAGVDAIYVPTRAYADVWFQLRRAIDRLRASPPGSRLYIVRTHLNAEDDAAWQLAFDTLGVTPRQDVVGFEPLLVLDRSSLAHG